MESNFFSLLIKIMLMLIVMPLCVPYFLIKYNNYMVSRKKRLLENIMFPGNCLEDICPFREKNKDFLEIKNYTSSILMTIPFFFLTVTKFIFINYFYVALSIMAILLAPISLNYGLRYLVHNSYAEFYSENIQTSRMKTLYNMTILRKPLLFSKCAAIVLWFIAMSCFYTTLFIPMIKEV